SEAGLMKTYMPTLEDGPTIGAALKTCREYLGLSLEQVAEKTCVRRAYLQAIEEMRLNALPSRPFTVGYIRAYANALDLDGEAAVARFKREEPLDDEPLAAPVGVEKQADPRIMLFLGAGALIAVAIIGWNVVQRIVTHKDDAPPPTAAAPTVANPIAAPAGPVTIGAPLPPPVESTTPTPYETPGLAAAAAADGSADAAEAAAKAAKAAAAEKVVPAPAQPLPQTFTPQGAVYGAAAEAAAVVLQARKPASIIVRGADGSVYFARQLAAGEAYRAPQLAGLTLDVSDPAAFQVFSGGASKGLMPAAQVAVSKLAAE